MGKTALSFAILMLALGLNAQAAMFKYNELMIKDYDEMSQMVQDKLSKARAVGSNSSDENVDDAQAVEHLREAMKLIYSRPNSDNMIAKLTPDVRRELVGYSAFERTINSIAVEALAVMKADKAAPSQQASALFVLENILSEIGPEVSENMALRKVVDNIKAADTEVSDDVRKDLKIRGMFTTRNPSDLAGDILKKYPVKAKEKKKKTKKAKDDDE